MVFFVIIRIVFNVAFVFLFFFVWLLSKERIISHRASEMVQVNKFWTYAAHAEWYAVPWQTHLFAESAKT
jgi:hypothetical protein